MDKGAHLKQMYNLWSGCRFCPRLQGRKQIVFGDGNPDADILIIGEAPGANEEATGLPFVGKAGNLLDILLAQASARPEVIHLFEELTGPDSSRLSGEASDRLRQELRGWLLQEFFYTNTIMCRPPENADPIPTEVNNCNPRLLETIYTVDPMIIITCGKIATETVLKKKSGINGIRGQIHEMTFQGKGTAFTYPVMPIFHTSYLMRKNDFNNNDGDGIKTYMDILKVMHIVDELRLQHYGTPKPDKRPPLSKER